MTRRAGAPTNTLDAGKHSMQMSRLLPLGAAVAIGLLVGAGSTTDASAAAANARVQRALIFSIDGMHAIDLALYVQANPNSNLAQLARRGVTYPNARTPLLGDSSPGLVSLATGGTPATTGIHYSPMYDRALSPAKSKDCSERGTVVYVDEKAAKDMTREDSGGGIDVDKLPRDPAKGCSPVFPRSLVRVNTMFEVVKKFGGRTAWIDQHDMYNDYLVGPAGNALDDSRALERKGTPGTLEGTTAQDGRRVDLLLNQIRGLDSSGKNKVGVPKLFGMGFISFGVLQKSEGYVDAKGTPGTQMKASLDAIDQSFGRIVGELKAQKLYDSTLIVLTSKHGQSPMDLQKRRIIDRNVVRNAVNSVQPGLLAHASLDSIGLVWLKDSTKVEEVAAVLRANSKEAGIQKIYWGPSSAPLVNSPKEDSRAPDLVIQPELGTFYAEDIESAAAKALLAEHGGMLDEDTNVPLVLSFAGARGSVNVAPVFTHQVAPTVLQALGLDPNALQAVQKEGTRALPGVDWK
jgi:Type I phosphodiesterase / nucleotide pyrophosphatase